MQVIEGEKDPAFVENDHPPVDGLSRSTRSSRATSIQAKLTPILERHWNTVELIKQRSAYKRGVVSFDLTDTGVDGYNKFIPYYFHPETTYNVALTQSEFRTKISVGSNPWSPRPRLHNIAEICERYGGGGHAVVGAVSLKREDVELGRKYMAEIIEELQFPE
jgi:hypothetical protein